jgi:hypothetical protein
MLIAYLSTDEVNQDLARQMADECEVTVSFVSLAETIGDGPYNALLLDLDYLPSGEQTKLLSQLLKDLVPLPVAVHSYNLKPEQVEVLRKNGVAVFRRLDLEIFQILRLAVLAMSSASIERDELFPVGPWSHISRRAGQTKSLPAPIS